MDARSKVTGWQIVDVARIVPATSNYKLVSDATTKALHENMKRHAAQGRGTGQLINVIVRETRNGQLMIVNGNHRLREFREQGITKALVFNVGTVTDNEATRIAIETNETKFEPDFMLLNMRLGEVGAAVGEDELKKTTTFSMRDIRAGIETSNWSWKSIQPVVEWRMIEGEQVVILVHVFKRDAKVIDAAIKKAFSENGIIELSAAPKKQKLLKKPRQSALAAPKRPKAPVADPKPQRTEKTASQPKTKRRAK